MKPLLVDVPRHIVEFLARLLADGAGPPRFARWNRSAFEEIRRCGKGEA